jgi:hypothetical protein
MPRLGEFISIASKHGVKKKHGPVLMGPNGPGRIYYLQRQMGDRMVILPDLRSDHVLKRDTVAVWCETLGLPPEDFGLPPYQAP